MVAEDSAQDFGAASFVCIMILDCRVNEHSGLAVQFVGETKLSSAYSDVFIPLDTQFLVIYRNAYIRLDSLTGFNAYDCATGFRDRGHV